MNPLLLDEGQRDLSDLLRKAVAERSPLERVQTLVDGNGSAFDTQLWSTLVDEIGVAAMRLPEASGGMDAGFREIGVVVEELARGLVPVPYLSSGVLAAAAVAGIPGASDVAEQIGAGSVVALATSEDPGSSWTSLPTTTSVSPDGNGWVVSGRKHHVLGAVEARTLLVSADLDGDVALVAVDVADAVVTRCDSLDLTRTWATVDLVQAPARLLGRGADVSGALDSAYDEFAAALALEQAGISQAVLDLTVDYLRTRVQFAQPIGSFQAVKHACADLAVLVDQIRTAADHAARSIGTPDAAEAVALATAVCHPRAEEVVFESMQLLGGIGFTWEHPMHLFVRRATANARMLAGRGTSREAYLQVCGF